MMMQRMKNPEAFADVKGLLALQSSPSGCRAGLIETHPNVEANRDQHSLWIYENHKVSCLNPSLPAKNFQWIDDETVLVHQWQRATEETVLYTQHLGESGLTERQRLPIRILNLKRSTGTRYVAQARIDSNHPDEYLLTREALAEARRQASLEGDCHVLDELPFWFNAEGITNKTRKALFLVDIATGECRRLTEPLFQTGSYVVDGDILIYEGESYDRKATLRHDVYELNLSDGSRRCLYCGGEYNMGNGMDTDAGGLVLWGHRVLVLANTNILVGRRLHKRFYELDRESGEIRLFCDYPYSIRACVNTDIFGGANPLFVPHGTSLYFLSTRVQDAWVMELTEDGQVRPVFQPEGAVNGIAFVDGKLLMMAVLNGLPQELYTLQDGRAVLATAFNQDFAALPGRTAEPLEFTSHGLPFRGFVLKPREYDPSKSYPGVLMIHGGPNVVYSNIFSFEMQMLSSRGYFVFFCNPEGSEGRGDEFMKIEGRYGCEDYETVMTFTDEVLRHYPALDAGRLAVSGGSYGGFMTNWVIGHTDRFACAVSQCSFSNQLSKQLLADTGFHRAVEQAKGSLFDHVERTWACSPLQFAGNVKTPTLFIHCDEDYRCPVDQGLQMFSALLQRGVETRFCLFHGESHGISRGGKPQNRLRRLREIVGWLDAHLKG